MDRDNQSEYLDALLDDPHFKEAVFNKSGLLDDFIRSHPASHKTIEIAIRILKSQRFSVEEDIEEDFNEIRSKLFDYNLTADLSNNNQESRSINKWWWAAAAIIFCCGLGYWLISNMEFEGNSSQLADVNESGVIKINPAGQKSTIILSDGSKVILNAESSISYPKQFGSTRAIKLSGEAFFEVTQDPEKPFIVITGNLSTTALGTSFNIRHYPDEQNSYVSLATGKVLVKVQEGSNEIQDILVPGEQVISKKDQVSLQKINYNYKDVFLWKEKVIYFNHADWATITKTLERWYGVKISSNEPLRIVDYTGQFDNQSLELVLKSLSYSLGFNYNQHSSTDEIHVKFKKPKNM
ncbi:MAG: FecR domain-containing protein [Cyclobacteriaceae bacterium]